MRDIGSDTAYRIMLYMILKRAAVLAISSLASISSFSVAADDHKNPAPFGSKEWDMQRWNLECAPKGCFIFLDNSLAGDNTVEVGVDRQTKQPALFGFITEGDADQTKNIFVTFAKTSVDSARPECKGSSDEEKPADCYHFDTTGSSIFQLTLADCSKGTCVARVKGQYVSDAKTGKQIDLLDNFINNNHVLLAYTDINGNLIRKMLDLNGFKDIYQEALKQLQ